MTEAREEPLEKQRARALDVFKPAGAVVTPQYLERRQEIVGVNKSDLEDILEFDGLAAGLSAMGMFLLSGAAWLLIDKVTEMETFTVTTAVGICGVSIVSGVGFLLAGIIMHRRKRGRIERMGHRIT